MVQISKHGLVCEQQKDLESHQREPHRRNAAGYGSASASRTAGHLGDDNRRQYEGDQCLLQYSGKTDVHRALESMGIPELELRAPKHDVQVVGDGRKVAIDRGRGKRLQQAANLRRTVRHHPKGMKYSRTYCVWILRVHSSQQASMIPREISLPLNMTMSSRA